MHSSFISHILIFADHIKYLLVFIGAIIEGPILMVAAGFLLHSDIFSVVPLYASLIAGDLVGDVFWYAVGYYFAEPMMRKHGHILSVTPELFEKAKRLFNKYHYSILLISKITMGFGMALGTLVVAGATKVPFRTYMLLNAIGGLLFVAGMIGIGYVFGHAYDAIGTDFKIVALVSVSAILVLASYGFIRYMKKKITS